MELTLDRLASDDDSTIGALFVNGRFQSFTCEDEYRIDKVPGETRIPAGKYRIDIRIAGGMAPKYRARYGDWHRGMIWLQDVPGFEWIYIHTGNTDDHTEGCILVGYGAMARRGDTMNVQQSRPSYEELAREIFAAIDAGEEVWITITDRDLHNGV